MPTPENETYTAAEIAVRLDITERTVLRHAAAGTLPFPCVRVGRCIRFPRAAVDAALGLLTVAGSPGPMRAVRGGAVVELRG